MCIAGTAQNVGGMTDDRLYQMSLAAKSAAEAIPSQRAGAVLTQEPYSAELKKRGDAINAASAADRAAFDASKAEQERVLAARQEQIRNEQLGKASELDAQQRQGAMQITIAQDAAANARNGAIAPASRESRAPTAGGGAGDRRKKRMGSRAAGPSLRIGGGTGLNIGT